MPDRASALLHALDEKRAIFRFDARISSPHTAGPDGYARMGIDPSLLFENQRHLRPKAKVWLAQHRGSGESQRQREEMIEFLGTVSTPRPWFHQVMLAEYQTQFGLSMLNEAYGVLLGSISQVYLADLMEMPRFARFLGKLAHKAKGLPAQELVAVYSFELPTGAMEARLRMPPFFGTFMERLETESFVIALRKARGACQTLRDRFRQVDADARSYRCADVAAGEMTGPTIREWNAYVEGEFGDTHQAMLLRSDVVAVEIRAGVTWEELSGSLPDCIRSRGTLLRFSPPRQSARFARDPEGLRALNVQSVIPFEKKLFRLGAGYRNKRSVIHQGVGSAVSFPVSIGAQVSPEDLNDRWLRPVRRLRFSGMNARVSMRRVETPSRIGAVDTINFIEAGLISYFQPRYHDKFRKREFPSRQHQSYERMFVEPVDVGALELETWTSLGCRLYSASVAPRFVHMKPWAFNGDFDLHLLAGLESM